MQITVVNKLLLHSHDIHKIACLFLFNFMTFRHTGQCKLKTNTHWWFLFNFLDGKAPLNTVMLSSCSVGHFLQTGWLFFTRFDYWQFFWIETRWKHRRDMCEKTGDETYCGAYVPSTKLAVLQTALPWSQPMRDERCCCLWQPENWRDSRLRGMDIYNVMGKHTHACSHTHMHT